MLFFKILTRQASEQIKTFSIIFQHLLQKLAYWICGLDFCWLFDVIIDNIGILVETESENNPLFTEKLFNFISVLNEEEPVTHLLLQSLFCLFVNSKWRHFYFERFKIGFNWGKVFFDFTPFCLPIFNFAEHVKSILSA